MENPSICAKYDPYLEKQASWIIPKTPNDSNMGSDSGLAIPPQELWGGVYDHNTALYLSAGQSHVETMRSITETSNFRFEDGDRILDFGCAGGRMIRWFNDLSDKCDIWGTDVSQACILWCQQHLSPPFKFVTTTSFPHLPFEDGYFKFIYAGSVFTHIPALADAWLLELKRVLCPGGRIYITVHDKHCLEIILAEPQKNIGLYETLISHSQESELKSDFGIFTISKMNYQRGFDSQVFYDIDFLCENWGRVLNVLSVTPEAYAYQSAILLGK